MKYEIIQGDVLEALRMMPSASFDGCITDPPYGLGSHQPTPEEIVAYLSGANLDTKGDFMGKDWMLPSVAVWRELRRVLRPGAHTFAFGGSRMFDLLFVGMRMGGFEMRDELAWLYGQGMPKNKRLERAISMHLCTLPGRHFEVNLPKKESKRKPNDHVCPMHPTAEPWIGYGTGLRPSYEPIALARAPLEGTLAENALKHGTGGLHIDGGRVGYFNEVDLMKVSIGVEAIRERGGVMNNSWKNSSDLSGANPAHPKGRWPPNVALSHLPECKIVGTRKVITGIAIRENSGGKQFGSDEDKPTLANLGYAEPDGTEEIEAWECVPWCPVAGVDEQSGDSPGMSGGGTHKPDYEGGMFGGVDSTSTARGDSGGASRYFYCQKADRPEREFGCDDLPVRSGAEAVDREEDTEGVDNPRAGAGRTAKEVRNHHPTVKPIEVCKWEAKLVMPPPLGRPRRILVLYSGSGSEMVGCIRAGWEEIVGIERDPEFVAIALARIERWLKVPLQDDERDAVKLDRVAKKLDKKRKDSGQTSMF